MIAALAHRRLYSWLSTLLVVQMFFRHIWFNIKTLLAHGTIGCKIRLCDTPAKHFNFNLILNKCHAPRHSHSKSLSWVWFGCRKAFASTLNQSIANFSISKPFCVFSFFSLDVLRTNANDWWRNTWQKRRCPEKIWGSFSIFIAHIRTFLLSLSLFALVFFCISLSLLKMINIYQRNSTINTDDSEWMEREKKTMVKVK